MRTDILGQPSRPFRVVFCRMGHLRTDDITAVKYVIKPVSYLFFAVSSDRFDGSKESTTLCFIDRQY